MSGIVGVFAKDGQLGVPLQVSAMLRSLEHRGRDGVGQLCEAPIGFGHLKSHGTLEAVREDQPLVLEQPGLVLVADARIDNRSELKKLLDVPPGRDPTDAQLILLSYRRWGAECPFRLIGDFAFAIWDRNRRELFCARDPMGVKPLYYYDCDRFFAFATELKALFVLPIQRRINESQVVRHLLRSGQNREDTMYEGVLRLPAAHSLTVTDRAVARKEYWRLDAAPEVRFSTSEQYVEQFREIFMESVRARLRSASPIAAALSGGLDSSSIVCAARTLRSQESSKYPLHTYSVIFSDLSEKHQKLIDERSYATAVIRGGGFEPHFVRGDRVSPLTDVRRVLWHLDEPYDAPNLFLHWGMYAAAAQTGARVFLDGVDGDSAVSHGFGRLNGLATAGQWSVFESELRSFAQHRSAPPSSMLYHFGFPYLMDLAARGQWSTWIGAARELSRRFQLSRRMVVTRFGMVPRMAEAWHKLRPRRSAEDRLFHPHLTAQQAPRPRTDWTALERDGHIRTLTQPLYQYTLELADKCAAAFGLEPRYPFFDRRLIEFCVGIPGEQKFAGGWARLILRRAMEGILPPEVQWRANKANLSPNFHERFRAVDRTTVEQADRTGLGAYVDLAAYKDLMRRYFSDPHRSWGDPDTELLFRSTTLALWLSETAGHYSPALHCDDGYKLRSA
jgi:asparagine synthase (glutamine-hydrolysing)